MLSGGSLSDAGETPDRILPERPMSGQCSEYENL